MVPDKVDNDVVRATPPVVLPQWTAGPGYSELGGTKLAGVSPARVDYRMHRKGSNLARGLSQTPVQI